ncbi:hypothetical protein Droror1_Dr00022319 [Drosera rotundifolia]
MVQHYAQQLVDEAWVQTEARQAVQHDAQRQLVDKVWRIVQHCTLHIDEAWQMVQQTVQFVDEAQVENEARQTVQHEAEQQLVDEATQAQQPVVQHELRHLQALEIDQMEDNDGQ